MRDLGDDAAFGKPVSTEFGRFSWELGLLVATGRIVHPTVPSPANLWGHLDLRYVPISGLPPLRCALLWHRSLRDPTVRDLIATARDVLRARR